MQGLNLMKNIYFDYSTPLGSWGVGVFATTGFVRFALYTRGYSYVIPTG